MRAADEAIRAAAEKERAATEAIRHANELEHVMAERIRSVVEHLARSMPNSADWHRRLGDAADEDLPDLLEEMGQALGRDGLDLV